MSRRILFSSFFVAFAAVVIFYASAHVRVPAMNFDEAAQVTDARKHVRVSGTVVEGQVGEQDGVVQFMMSDKAGRQCEVEYDQPNDFTAGQLDRAAKSSSEISVIGRWMGDHFVASEVLLPAY